jgi:hypothetical protein
MMDFLTFLSSFSKPNIGRMLARPQQALAAALIHNSAQIALKCSRLHHFPTNNNFPVSLENIKRQFAFAYISTLYLFHAVIEF